MRLAPRDPRMNACAEPERSSATWADFLRSPAEALLACDFFETVTLSGPRTMRTLALWRRLDD